jgi:hypothetical protein
MDMDAIMHGETAVGVVGKIRGNGNGVIKL